MTEDEWNRQDAALAALKKGGVLHAPHYANELNAAQKARIEALAYSHGGKDNHDLVKNAAIVEAYILNGKAEA